MSKAPSKLPPALRSKYFWVLALFAGWMLFFDKHSVLTQIRLATTVNRLERDKNFYEEMIREVRQDLWDIEVNKEKYAREKYFLHKPTEDVFIIAEE
ncbi:MAG: hypothetical protein D6765_07645 [Bacteroidetes bacterium]|nr:MAG: hypothetical protein D6765_07645 [Bacteroidota bacterium]